METQRGRCQSKDRRRLPIFKIPDSGQPSPARNWRSCLQLNAMTVASYLCSDLHCSSTGEISFFTRHGDCYQNLNQTANKKASFSKNPEITRFVDWPNVAWSHDQQRSCHWLDPTYQFVYVKKSWSLETKRHILFGYYNNLACIRLTC